MSDSLCRDRRLEPLFYCLLFLVLLNTRLWCENTITIYEVDGKQQTDRPITLGRVFKAGEIPADFCPQPWVSGKAVQTYQSDVKNRWPDGSVRFAIISFLQTLSPHGSAIVSFQRSSSCNNSGYLNHEQLMQFNRENWDAIIEVTPSKGPSVAVSAKSVLGASNPAQNTFGDCKNNYWLKGPVVTAVIVQDCTERSSFDFGWRWDGVKMNEPSSRNSTYASFHPMFILYFYPTISSVRAEEILELPWAGRAQDQLADVAFKTAVPARTQWSHAGARQVHDVRTTQGSRMIYSPSANFSRADVGLPIAICEQSCTNSGLPWYTISGIAGSDTAQLSQKYAGSSKTDVSAYINLQVFGTRHRKTFWSGTAPAHIRIDHNWEYLKSSMAFPNYDPQVTANPDYQSRSATSFSEWIRSDKGEIGGFGGFDAWSADYSDDSEGAPLQREELEYLYNMPSCGKPGSACAKAWAMLTGELSATDQLNCPHKVNGASLQCQDSGGLGAWENIGNVPYHLRESRTRAGGYQGGRTNYFFCPGYADKNSTPAAPCGHGIGNAIGKSISRHAHPDAYFGINNSPIHPVGWRSLIAGGWSASSCDHWLDYSYTPYILTGDYYYLEDEYMAASFCLSSINPDWRATYTSNGFFAFMNPNAAALRTYAWGMQTVGRAGFIAPDGTPEQQYYRSMVNSNLEFMEGIMGITGTDLTPDDIKCDSKLPIPYNPANANRWDWARCTAISMCTSSGPCTAIPTALHAAMAGSCPIGERKTFMDPAIASADYTNWMYNAASIALAELREMGYSHAAAVSNEMLRQLEEKVQDSTYNPFLIQIGQAPLRDAAGKSACSTSFGQNLDPFISTYSRLKQATAARDVYTFDFDPRAGNIACADHGYSLIARAAGTFLTQFNVSSKDPNCPGGTCTAANTWNWLDTYVPYFGKKVPKSQSCGSSPWGDSQIKYALAPRVGTGRK